MKTMADKTGISVRSVVRGIQTLVDWNIVSKERERTTGAQWLNNRYVLLDKSVWKERPSATQSLGKPSAKSDKSQVPQGHLKDTHTEKDTHRNIKNPRVPSVAGFPGGTSPETEAPKTPSVKADPSPMFELLQWAIGRRDGAFPNKGKQFAAMKRMKQAGIGPNAIKERWEELEGKKFYQDNGLDFASVAASFDRKR